MCLVHVLTNILTCWQNYFGDAWNVFDFVIVLGSFIDIVYTEVNVSLHEYEMILVSLGEVRSSS